MARAPRKKSTTLRKLQTTRGTTTRSGSRSNTRAKQAARKSMGGRVETKSSAKSETPARGRIVSPTSAMGKKAIAMNLGRLEPGVGLILTAAALAKLVADKAQSNRSPASRPSSSPKDRKGVGAAKKAADKAADKKVPTPKPRPGSERAKENGVYVGESKGGVSFDKAFGDARKRGLKTFTWNGKKYNTKLAK